MALSSVSVVTNSLRLRCFDPRPGGSAAHRPGSSAAPATRRTSCSIAAAGVALVVGIVALDRYFDANARQVELTATGLLAPAPTIEVGAGTTLLVRFRNDGPDLVSCSVPGVPNVELNPRGGATQKVRFGLPGPGDYELVCTSVMASAGSRLRRHGRRDGRRAPHRGGLHRPVASVVPRAAAVGLARAGRSSTSSRPSR